MLTRRITLQKEKVEPGEPRHARLLLRMYLLPRRHRRSLRFCSSTPQLPASSETPTQSAAMR